MVKLNESIFNKNLTVQILHFVIFDVSYASYHFVKKEKLIQNQKI